MDFKYKADPNESAELLNQIMQFMADEENNTVYMIFFSMSEGKYNEYQSIVQDMIDSFKILQLNHNSQW